jgi:hypothetical protein
MKTFLFIIPGVIIFVVDYILLFQPERYGTWTMLLLLGCACDWNARCKKQQISNIFTPII